MLLALVLMATPDPTLMARLGAHAEATEKFGKNCSVTVDAVGEEYDSEGKATKTTKSSMRVTSRNGKQTRSLIKYEENGVDLTEKKRRELEAHEDKPMHSPLLPSEQSKYRFTQLAENRIGFEPVSKTPETFIGEATVDVEAGVPRVITLRPAKLPAFVDSLALTLTIDSPTPIGDTASKVTVKGVAGFLFIKKRFGIETTFRDYEAAK